MPLKRHLDFRFMHTSYFCDFMGRSFKTIPKKSMLFCAQTATRVMGHDNENWKSFNKRHKRIQSLIPKNFEIDSIFGENNFLLNYEVNSCVFKIRIASFHNEFQLLLNHEFNFPDIWWLINFLLIFHLTNFLLCLQTISISE